MRHFIVVAFFLVLAIAGSSYSQEDQVLQVTDFEDELEWVYSGGSIMYSFVEYQPFYDDTITPHSGEASLLVEYDNTGGEWQWSQINFPGELGAVDATGMTELHIFVYVVPGSTGYSDTGFEMRIEAGGANLGFQSTDVTGEWVELVWPIDTLTSTGNLGALTYFGGFIAPRGDISGQVYIDDIYFTRPADVPEVEIVTIYGFNEEDPDTLLTAGWISDDAGLSVPLLGEGEVEPSEGSNYMAFTLGEGWTNVIRTESALEDFDRWGDVKEIMVDARMSEAVVGWGAQSALVIQTGSGGWDQYAEASYRYAVDEWQTLVWVVDMEKHAAAFVEPAEGEDAPWMIIRFSTNNGSEDAGKLVFFDNFRVVVTKQAAAVQEWSLY